MLWNWYTVDACFLSPTGHITSNRMFASFCIGVIGLVLFLEFLRRLQREYDRLIQPQRHPTGTNDDARASNPSKVDGHGSTNCNSSVHTQWQSRSTLLLLRSPEQRGARYSPTLRQQIIRAVLYTMQFAVAYIIMFLAMYFNGYIIACIVLGVFIGFMIFSWDASGVTSK